MAISIVDPSSAAVVHHPGGLISVRCADYLGGSRGDLTTTSDSLAPTGTVAVEEQTIAAATTFVGVTLSSRWALASDTIVVPLVDLGREEWWYTPWISMRMEGSPPSTSRYLDSWVAHRSTQGVGVGVAFGIGSSMRDGFDWIGSAKIPNYWLRRFESTLFNAGQGDLDSEDFVVRAWGITGGDVAFYLDTLYFVPTADQSGSGSSTVLFFPNEFNIDPTVNGTLWRDEDNDPSGLPFGDGKFSVLHWQDPWAPGGQGWGGHVEFQQADNEPTAADVYGYEEITDDRKGYLFIPAGATDIPPESLLADDFSFEQTVHGTYGAYYVADIGLPWLRNLLLGASSGVQYFWDSPSTTRRGTFVESGDGFATTYFGNAVSPPSAATYPMPEGAVGWHGGIAYGNADVEGGFAANEGTTDPRLRSPWFGPHLECFVETCKVWQADEIQDANVVVGMRGTDSGQKIVGACLHFRSDGDVDLSLQYRGGAGAGVSWSDIVSATNVGSGSLGDQWWVKVEKRGYWWRAKAWADGDSEPDWIVEGAEHLQRQTTGITYIPYPWDDNWEGDTANDTWSGDPWGGTAGLAGGFGHPYIETQQVEEQARMRLMVSDYSLDWVPDANDPGDISLKLEMYDETVDFGTVTIPWGAHRFVVGALDNYLSDGDTHGFNVRLWKESGTRDFMTAGLGLMSFRGPAVRAFRPQIYRRVLG